MNLRLPAFLRAFGRSCVDWYDSWLDLTVIGIVWLFAQATIILGPPATFGVYCVVNSMIRTGENPGIKGAFEGAKIYFSKSLGWGAISWLVGFIAVVNVYFYAGVDSLLGQAARVFVLIVIALWLMTQFYAVPFFFAQEQENIFIALKNGFLLMMASLPYTLGLMIFVVLTILLSTAFVIPSFLGLPMLIPVLATRALYDRLEAYGLREKDIDPKEVE